MRNTRERELEEMWEIICHKKSRTVGKRAFLCINNNKDTDIKKGKNPRKLLAMNDLNFDKHPRYSRTSITVLMKSRTLKLVIMPALLAKHLAFC